MDKRLHVPNHLQNGRGFPIFAQKGHTLQFGERRQIDLRLKSKRARRSARRPSACVSTSSVISPERMMAAWSAIP